MPNWKKVITSGSNANLNSLLVGEITASGNISGSLTGSFKHLKTTTIEGNSPLTIKNVTELTFLSSSIQFANDSNLFGNPVFHGDINIYSGSAMLDEVDQVIFRSTNDSQPANGRLQMGDASTPLDIRGKTTNLSGSIFIDTTLVRNITGSTVSDGATIFDFGDYDAVHAEYKIKNGSNLRTGTVIGCFDGSSVDFTETSIHGIGDTSDASFRFINDGRLVLDTSGIYTFNVIAKAL